ncbi:MAG: vitamin K epoxide reductase family protein [Actinomycetaceae bacterium]|nr:vitamin K epoxide reductase family protein [Actinomycetaceae bacterium]
MNKAAKTPRRHRLGPINALVLIIGSALGLIASLGLLQTELDHLKDPLAALDCDLNVLIGCGSSLMSPQAHLVGLPNSAIGVAAFSATLTLGILMLLRVEMPPIVGVLAGVGALGGLAFVGYFLYLSASAFHSLCPYCLAVWSATLILASVLIPFALASMPASKDFGKSMQRHTWAGMISLHLLVVIIILFAMSDQIGTLF